MIGKTKILFKLAFIVAFITYTFWEYIKEKTGIRIFYPGIALSFVGYTYVINCLLKIVVKHEPQFKNIILFSKIVFLAAVNNLIDELFFDPTQISINEYIGFILIILITYFNGDNDT